MLRVRADLLGVSAGPGSRALNAGGVGASAFLCDDLLSPRSGEVVAVWAFRSTVHPVPTLIGHVAHILRVSAWLEMIRVHARRVVAFMHKLKPVYTLASHLCVINTVHPRALEAVPRGLNDSVIVMIPGALPLPASRIGYIPANQLDSRSRRHVPYRYGVSVYPEVVVVLPAHTLDDDIPVTFVDTANLHGPAPIHLWKRN